MLGDLNIAEPGALIGFAGPRVIEQTIRQKLPEGFQRSEFLLKHGMLDAVVPRAELKTYIAGALDFFCGPIQVSQAAGPSRMISYEESVRFLYSLGNELKAAKYDLVRIRARCLQAWAILNFEGASYMSPGPTAKARPAP